MKLSRMRKYTYLALAAAVFLAVGSVGCVGNIRILLSEV